MKAFFLFTMFVIIGCVHAIPGQMATGYGVPYCPAAATVTVADLCEQTVTNAGLNISCGKCTGGSACLNDKDVVYCVDYSCGDPRCHVDPEAFGKARAKAKKPK
jgi:hypothetical protein